MRRLALAALLAGVLFVPAAHAAIPAQLQKPVWSQQYVVVWVP